MTKSEITSTVKTVLFDLDGTLLPMQQDDFTTAYFDGLSKKLAPYGYEPQRFVGGVWHGTKAMAKNNGTQTNEQVFWKEFAELFGEKVYSDIEKFNEFYATDFDKLKSYCGYNQQANQDADEMDTQCDYWANDWNVIVVSVNYTKLDTKPMNYAVAEITDTVEYFKDNADKYHADVTKFSVIGHSAGGFIAAKAAIALDAKGSRLQSQILLCPWTTGLPDKVSSTLAPVFFSLGGDNEISQKSPQYQKVLKEAGISYTVKEYEGGQHPFIHSPYPEFQKGLTAEEKKVFATEEQFALSRQAEADIKDWLKSL